MQNFFTAESFAGRVALVTGATRGIGRAVAMALAECGAKVIGTATSEAGAAQISEVLGDKGRGIVLNVTDAEASKAAVDVIVAEFGRIDILVNNAGITRDMLAMRLSDEAWDAVIETNLTAVFRLTRAVLRPMMKQRFGRIINMSSVVGAMGNAGQANYAAAKAGMIGMSKSVAREVASHCPKTSKRTSWHKFRRLASAKRMISLQPCSIWLLSPPATSPGPFCTSTAACSWDDVIRPQA